MLLFSREKTEFPYLNSFIFVYCPVSPTKILDLYLNSRIHMDSAVRELLWSAKCVRTLGKKEGRKKGLQECNYKNTTIMFLSPKSLNLDSNSLQMDGFIWLRSLDNCVRISECCYKHSGCFISIPQLFSLQHASARMIQEHPEFLWQVWEYPHSFPWCLRFEQTFPPWFLYETCLVKRAENFKRQPWERLLLFAFGFGAVSSWQNS